MGKRGRIISSQVRFARDRKHPEKQIDKPKKKNKLRNNGLGSSSPSFYSKYVKNTMNHVTGER